MADQDIKAETARRARPAMRSILPLKPYQGARPPAPGWFIDAIAAPCEAASVSHLGARISYRRWGRADAPGLLFVHGKGAHEHWWDFIAPFFAADWNVAALSFSGMGSSDWREAYSLETFAGELLAVCEAAGMLAGGRRPFVVAHSFGGFVAAVAAARSGQMLSGAIILDCPLRPPPRDWVQEETRERVMVSPAYPDLETILGRFRLAPPQECPNDFILDHVARYSVKPVERADGQPAWTWKFDPHIWPRMDLSGIGGDPIADARCRISLMRGELSTLVTPQLHASALSRAPKGTVSATIPQAAHHVMLDQPLATVAAINAQLGAWRAMDGMIDS